MLSDACSAEDVSIPSQLVCAVVCDYELRVRVHSYLNADSRCAVCTRSLVNPIYSCCDNQTNTGVCSGDERCDTFFQYCLRPLGATGIGCPFNGTANTNFFSFNTDILLDIGDTVLGTDNPFLYFGVTWRVSNCSLLTILDAFYSYVQCKLLTVTINLRGSSFT